MMRSVSVDAMEARRSRLASEIRGLQEHSDRVAFEYKPPLPLHEAKAQRENISLHMELRHAELVARARDLDRITADAIKDSQERNAAARAARWERAGIYHGGASGYHSLQTSAVFTTFLEATPSRSAPATPARGTVPELPRELPASWIGGVGASPDALGSRAAPSRSQRTHARCTSPMRPVLYDKLSPRQRPPEERHYTGSPYRPVLPHQAEAAYVAETPLVYRRRRPTFSQDSIDAVEPVASVPAYSPMGEHGFVSLRARRERLAREVLLLSCDHGSHLLSPAQKWGVQALNDSM